MFIRPQPLRSLLRALPAVLALVLAAGACSSDSTGVVTRADVAGSYRATVFTTIAGGVTTDMLARGASIQLTLNENGSMTGALAVPEGGAALNADLVGTWGFDPGGNVLLNPLHGTFVGALVYTRAGDQLNGAGVVSQTQVSVVLTRTGS